MLMITNKTSTRTFVAFIISILLVTCKNETPIPTIDHDQLTNQYYGNDAQWYLDNVPFFECSDKEIEAVYYYRWKLYKAHIRNVGDDEYIITEFINDVHWDRDPYSTINAATMHHIYEGRWLKDDRYMDSYINYMYQKGGNNRSYSEGIADAAYARYLVNGDSSFIVKQLDSMKMIYNKWNDHWESAKDLYYIPAMPDATEYTIASIDGSGGKDGFDGGDAFRPTLNSYMYGNAMAISKIALLKNDSRTSSEYRARASHLKATIEKNLWNDSLQHFTDRFKVNNQYVHYWDFIRGRELAGMIPWYYNLPEDNPTFNKAWRHILDTTQLLGRFGLRTNEPSYEYYFKQFVFNNGKPGSQWNGPSWPYQTSQVITGMANFLNDYNQEVITNSDYLKILRLFTKQHYLLNGKINLVENYDPNKGGPIVHFYWSNHYNHSSYNNLVISGLCGIRPSEGDTLTINPLVDNSIEHFYLDDVHYHGHKVSLIYDRDGRKYNLGTGLTVLVDGRKVSMTKKGNKYKVLVGPALDVPVTKRSTDFALNINRKGFPQPSASVNLVADSLYQAIDGRIWYFPEISNRWTTEGSTSSTDWYAVDFGQSRELSSAKIYLYTDEKAFHLPEAYSIEFRTGNEWLPVKEESPKKLIGNTASTITFNKVSATGLRVTFKHAKNVALVELECYN
jgi:Trehalase/F5/8 type C domain